MYKFSAESKRFWQNTSAVIKFLLAVILMSMYIKLLWTIAPNNLNSAANKIIFSIAALYIAWQVLIAFWQIKDIRYNYIMLKNLQQPESANWTFLHNLYQALISDFEPLSEKYEAHLIHKEARAQAEFKEAEKEYEEVLAYQKYLNDTYRASIKDWYKQQALYKNNLQEAIDYDISFAKTNGHILGKLGKQIIKQRKKLISLQKKTIWPEPRQYKFIYHLYHVIPKDVKDAELMRQSLERLKSDDFWKEYLNASVALGIITELKKYQQLVDQAKALIET